ncbi:unnamed protein product, partial [Rodentolepis nana]|uniref:Skp1_POZ domain-containing protein n=1 Tax=Rodentolepis nana TaxID=102285 RepID=A0A0R3TGT4_RODNA
MKNSDFIRSADTLKGPMRNNADCLVEVNRLLQFFDLNTMTFPGHAKGKYDVEPENDDVMDQIIAFCKNVILKPTMDISKMELHKIQFRRAITMLVFKDISKSPEIQIDCLLILRIATLCRRYFDSNADILKEAPEL